MVVALQPPFETAVGGYRQLKGRTPAMGTIALPPAVWNGVVEELD
jgi:hypothetical protein